VTEADGDVIGDRIRAERRARELVADMHWRGMVVPALYTHMAAEFQDLVSSGDYAAWVADGGGPGPGRSGARGRDAVRLTGPTREGRRGGAGPGGG
jgi:hypothetical protein